MNEGQVKPGYYPEFPVDRILKPKFSFRMNVDEGIDDLVYQIYAAGMVIEPIICWPAPGRPGYVEVGPGERRLRAAKWLRMETIPVIVREMDACVPFPNRFSEILNQITEGQARQILSAPPEKRTEIAEWIIERYEENGEIPSAREIRGFVQDLLEAEEEPQERGIAVETMHPAAVQSEIESAEAVSIASELDPESSHGYVGEAASSVEAESEGAEAKEMIGNAEPPTRSDAGSEVEERAEVRVCPVCGRPPGEEDYERLRRRFSRFSGLFD